MMSQWLEGEEADALLREYESDLDNSYKDLSFFREFDETGPFRLFATFDSLHPILGMHPGFARKYLEDGLSQTGRWLCCQTSAIKAARITEESTDVRDFLQHAFLYTKLLDAFHCYNRGLFGLKISPPARIVRFLQKANTYRDLSGLIHEDLGNANSFRTLIKQDSLRAFQVLRKLIGSLSAQLHQDGRLTFDPRSKEFARIVDATRPIFDRLPRAIRNTSEIDVGGITQQELRRYWHALWSYSFVFRAVAQRRRIVTAPCLRKDAYLELIAQLSGLPSAAIRRITDYYLFGTLQNRPDFLLQPIWKFGGDLIWSASLVVSSNYERNFLKLLARSKETANLAATIIGDQEPYLGRAIGRFLADNGYQYALFKKFKVAPYEGDIDILAWTQRRRSEVLIVEVKACLPIDELPEVRAVTDAMRVGQEQVRKSIVALQNQKEIRALYRFVPWDSVSVFRGVVLSEETDPDSSFDHMDVPGASFLTVRELLRRRDVITPTRMWEAILNEIWLEGMDIEAGSEQVQLAGVTYELPLLSYAGEGAKPRE